MDDIETESQESGFSKKKGKAVPFLLPAGCRPLLKGEGEERDWGGAPVCSCTHAVLDWIPQVPIIPQACILRVSTAPAEIPSRTNLWQADRLVKSVVGELHHL